MLPPHPQPPLNNPPPNILRNRELQNNWEGQTIPNGDELGKSIKRKSFLVPKDFLLNKSRWRIPPSVTKRVKSKSNKLVSTSVVVPIYVRNSKTKMFC